MDQRQNHDYSPIRSPNPDQKYPNGTQLKHGTTVNIGFLCTFTILYLIPILSTSSVYLAFLAAGLFLALFGVGLVFTRLVTSSPAKIHKVRSRKQAVLITITSFAEFGAAAIGLWIGFWLDIWWLFGILLAGTVAVHFLSLTWTYRRTLDYYALTLAIISLLLLITSPMPLLRDLWAVSGAIMASCTALYVVELSCTLRSLSESQVSRPFS